MGNRGARRVQPQPIPSPINTYIPGPEYPSGPGYPVGPGYPSGPGYLAGPGYPAGPACPPRGRRQMRPPYSPYYPRQYPGYSPMQASY